MLPEDLEITAIQLLKATLQVMPEQTTDINPFRGAINYLCEPRLGDASAKAWYGFAPRSAARNICYVHQAGFEQMVTRVYFDPKTNSRIHQFEGRFAAAVNNYRGVVRNAGE